MNVVLVDPKERGHFLPFAHTRPVSEIRVGIWTIAEKWEKIGGARVSYQTNETLRTLFPKNTSEDNFFVDARTIAHESLIQEVFNLPQNSSLYMDDRWVATHTSDAVFGDSSFPRHQLKSEFKSIERNWHIFQLNGWAMEKDFQWIEKNKTGLPIPDGVTVLGDRLFLEQGAAIMPSIINTLEGPVYLEKNSLIMEGCMVRGGLALGEGSQLKMGAKIYGPTTIGKHSKVGGEVNNSVIFGYSNKGHDGFLGNSVIGEWCNLGADTNTSNLKNNYSEVKVWNYQLNEAENTGGQFCGLMMGDHAKCGINTMFNTGTVCGVFANVFDGGFPPKQIKDFSWGGREGAPLFQLDKALEMAERVMSRRNIELSQLHSDLYRSIYDKLDAKA